MKDLAKKTFRTVIIFQEENKRGENLSTGLTEEAAIEEVKNYKLKEGESNIIYSYENY